MSSSGPPPGAASPPTGLEQALQHWSRRAGVRRSALGAPHQAGLRRQDFAAGWEAALAALERCAVHWAAFGLNEAGRISVEALRDAVAVTWAGWECSEPGHPPACRWEGAEGAAELAREAREGRP